MTIYKRNYELEKAANALAPTNQQFNFDNFQNNFSMKHSDIFKLTFKDAHLYKVKEAVLSLLEGWNLVHPNNLLGTVGVMYYEQDSKNVVLELYFYVYNEDGIYATIEPYNFISSIGIEYDYTFEQFHYQNPKNYLYQKMIGNVFIIALDTPWANNSLISFSLPANFRFLFLLPWGLPSLTPEFFNLASVSLVLAEINDFSMLALIEKAKANI